MNNLVFGQFVKEDNNLLNAVKRYFKFVRDYLVLVSFPARVYEWETWSKYWYVLDRISGNQGGEYEISEVCFPLQSANTYLGNLFLDPENHEGIDIYLADGLNKRINSPGTAHIVSEW